MDIVIAFAIPVIVGVGVGILSGLLGIGGGTIMVPVFRLVFGLDAIVCTATSLFTIIPTSISGAISHVRNKTCVPALGLAAGVGGACTSPLGVYLSSISPAWLIMVAAAVVIGYSAISMFRKAHAAAKKRREAAPDAAVEEKGAPARAAAESASDAVIRPTKKQIVASALIGLGAGIMSGYVGVGGGFIIVPLLMTFAALPMRLTSGTSLIAVMILAIPGTIEQGLFGHIDYVAGLAMAVGSIPGAIIGAKLVRKVPELQLRILFGCVLIVAAVLLVVNEFGILG